MFYSYCEIELKGSDADNETKTAFPGQENFFYIFPLATQNTYRKNKSGEIESADKTTKDIYTLWREVDQKYISIISLELCYWG